MNIFKFKSLLLLALIGLAITQVGCVKEQFDVTPVLRDTSSLVATATIAQVKLFQGEIEIPSRFKFDTLTPLTAVKNFWKNLYQTTGDTALIINGYVTSNDSAGNFYEVFTIQDASGGIDIKVNAAKLYSLYGIKPGQRVLVKLNNLNISYYRGTYQIGSTIVDEGAVKLTGIDINQLSKYVVRSGAKKPVEPIELSISELNFSHVQKLVRIKNVQFWDASKAWAIPTVNTNRMVLDCENKSLIVRTSGYAYFSQNIVPNGNGTITGVLGRFNDDLQLVIRDPADAELTGERCGGGMPDPNTTIAELKAMSVGAYSLITSDIVIEAVVAANDFSGNLYKQLFLQDATGGIELTVNLTRLYIDFPLGTKVRINCKGMYVGSYHNAIKLGGLNGSDIGWLLPSLFYQNVSIIGVGNIVAPKLVTIATLHDSLIGRLVKLNEVQFVGSEVGLAWFVPDPAYPNNTSINRNLEDFWGDKVFVRNSKYASFANSVLPSNSGEFTAILSKYDNDFQLYVRTLDDVKLTQPRIERETPINETFVTATLNQPIDINGWQSKVVAGTKNWIAKDVGTATDKRCAEMNAVNVIGETSNTAWLISPQVDLSAISPRYLSFRTQYANWKDYVSLELYVSSNYNGVDPTLATWTKVENAYIVKSTDAAAVWVSSGIVNLSAYSGNVHFGFKYVREGAPQHQATTFRVDDFQVFGRKL